MSIPGFGSYGVNIVEFEAMVFPGTDVTGDRVWQHISARSKRLGGSFAVQADDEYESLLSG